MRTLLAMVLICAASTALADEPSSDAQTAQESSSNPGLRHRYDPGLAIGVLADARGFEGLDGAASAAGVGVGYAFDLVSFELQALQSLSPVAEHKPTYLKLNMDFAFATFGGFSVLGLVGGDYVIHGPDRQTLQLGGNMFGPELALGARYRISPLIDVVGYGSVALWAARHGPERSFVEPGAFGGVQIHPFGSE